MLLVFPSMLRLPELEVIIPKTPAEAARALFRHRNSEFIAGGTDLITRIRERAVRPSALIDLSGLDELRYIKVGKRTIKVGAMTTLTELLSNEEVMKHEAFKALWEKLTSPTIANMATVGGSLCLRSSVSDLLTIMLAMGGTVKVIGRKAASTLKIEGFLVRKRLRGLLTEASFPRASPNMVTLFDKITASSSKYSLASLALSLRINSRGTVNGARVAANCAKNGAPSRIPRAEKALIGKKLTRESIESAAERLRATVQPHADFMAPDWYRIDVLTAMFRRLGLRAVEILEGAGA